MAQTLVHRGPDDHGVWVDAQAGVALAHRRLSIIDISPLGHQPMRSVSGRYTIVYNGEIYNFEELRSELNAAALAPAWRGHSDTEVFLAAVEAWGLERALQRAVGMFAIALWDRDAQVLTLARDRIGEKPLYYGRIGSAFCFASELKAIVALHGDRLEIDRRVLAQFMQFGYVSAPRCIYRGLNQLSPGTFVRIGKGGSVVEPRRYWTAPTGQDLATQLAGADDTTLVDMVHDRLKSAVGLQMVSDVPLGAFLSGGIDSSVVVALMQAQSRQPVKTYTIGFHERQYDEAPFARAVAMHLGTDHTELYVNANDAAAVIPELPSIYDEPFADSSQIPTVMVARLTRQHVTVSLSGDGGDELFCGYPRYDTTAALWKKASRLPTSLRASVAALLQSGSESSWDRLLAFLPADKRQLINGRRIHRLSRVLASPTLAALYVRLISQWLPAENLVLGAGQPFDETAGWDSEGTLIEQMRRFDLVRYLPDDLLVKVDRACMSASLESRAPLLDHRVVELAFSLPDRVLVRHSERKWVLRRVLERYVPRHLFERPKAGFAVPLAEWLRGPLKDWAGQLLDPRRLSKEGYLDAAKVNLLWNQHQSSALDRSAYLWNVIAFQAWLARP
jgi:asparagine synthase (glutamine-hydrolysing)